jgi:hypothetical protein
MRGNTVPTRNPENVGPSQDARYSQDVRGNLAVQPTANPGTLKLKKAAVKIVTPAGPAPGAQLPEGFHKPKGAVISTPRPLTPVSDLQPEAKMYVKFTLRRHTDSRTLN